MDKRNSTHYYRQWCAYLRECGLKPRCNGFSFARSQWNMFWDGVRDQRLCDAAFWLIRKFT